MIKNILTYAALALFTLGLNACSQEDDFAPLEQGQVLRINARSTSDKAELAPFTGDFTLELWNDGVHTTHQMTYTEGTGWSPAKVDKLGTTITALAHGGETVTFTSATDYSVALTADQSTEDAFNAADVMIATGTVDENHSLSLNFKHHFAKVSFQVDLASEFDNSDKITNLYVMTKGGSTPEVTAYCSAADSDADYDCSAYIPAGTYTVGDTFVKIDIGEFTGDKKLEANMSEKNVLTLTAGTHYTFTLKVGKNKVTIGQVITNNIDNPFDSGWDNDSETNLN